MPQSPTTTHATLPLLEVAVVVDVVAVVVDDVAPPGPVPVVDDDVWAAPPLPPVRSSTKCGVVEQAAIRLAAQKAA
jgi:hypothetical protein